MMQDCNAEDRSKMVEKDEIDLLELWKIVKSNRKIIIRISALTTFVTLLYALFATPIYQATVLVQPVAPPGEKQDLGSLSGLGSLGGLASIAGIGGSDVDMEANLALLESRAFLLDFVEKNKLLPVLFHDRWSAEKQEWLPKPFLVRWVSQSKARMLAFFQGSEFEPREDSKPTFGEVNQLFQDIRILDRDLETGLVSLSIEWEDPEIASGIANGIILAVNQYLRKRDLEETSEAIDYLRAQIIQTQNPTVLDSLSNLVQVQTQKAMLANVREEYAFRVLDPALVPEKPARPRRSLMVIGGMFLGLILGLGVVVFRNFGVLRQ
jgi:uncharacterized protein involved in exopolysaccharide biosynthesis